MDAIIINRVSDAHQIDGYSLPEQEYQGKRYVQEHGLKVLKIFTFQESASKASQRKQFDEIIRFITNYDKKSPLAIVAEKHDRLYRNHLNKAQFQIFLEEGKIEVHLYKDNRRFTKDSPPSDLLVDDVMTSVNEYQARNIGREAKKGMMAKARDGWFPHRAPFGYVNVHPENRDDKNRRRGTIEPAQWGEALVSRMYGLKAMGCSLQIVRQTVLNEGLVPADRIARFHLSLVEKVLKSPFYMGEFIWAGERFEGKHRPLVSRQLWDAVQQTFISKANPKYRVTKRAGSLSGFIKCACGCQVTYDPKEKPSGRRFEYYRCANGKGAHAKLTYVSEDRIFDQFTPAVESISISEQLAKDIAKGLNRTQEKARRAHERYIEAQKAHLSEMDGAEDKLYDDFRKGILDEQGYRRQVERLRGERQRLTEIVGAAHADVTDAALVTAKKILELAKRAPELYLRRSPQERRDFLEKILSNPVLDGVTVRFEMKKPFSLVAKMASSPAWGG